MAATGVGAITVGGITFDSIGLLLASAAVVALGAVLVRVGFRRGKGSGQA